MNLEKGAISPTQIVASILSTWEDLLLKEQTPQTKRPYVYASGYSPCTRQMTLDMVEGDKRPGWTADQLARFERGEDREVIILSKLNRVGQLAEPPFRVIGQQERFELRDRKGRVVIVGKTDASLDYGNKFKPKLEIKSWSQNVVQKIHSFEDLFTSYWTRRGAYQILAYLYGSGEPIGFMLLDRSGIPLLLPVELEKHLDKIETFLTQAEIAMDHKEAGTLPPYITDLDECRRCWAFQFICDPPTASGEAQVLIDSELEAELARREELKEAHEEYSELDKDIKEQLRGVEAAICGPFIIQGKWSRNTVYDIPPAIKDQFKQVNDRGRFTLTVTKI